MAQLIEQPAAPYLKPKPRALYAIANDIRSNWPNPHFAAVPYITAMRALSTIGDKYGEESARSIVTYFLGNAQTWKGDNARRIKDELKAMLK